MTQTERKALTIGDIIIYVNGEKYKIIALSAHRSCTLQSMLHMNLHSFTYEYKLLLDKRWTCASSANSAASNIYDKLAKILAS